MLGYIGLVDRIGPKVRVNVGSRFCGLNSTDKVVIQALFKGKNALHTLFVDRPCAVGGPGEGRANELASGYLFVRFLELSIRIIAGERSEVFCTEEAGGH
jgi:hypothetical protein